ncbi:hypothetical protein CEXT_517761 [Caerostris extrusa]|uniref:Cation/H+ exchanger domain-containing protein n=1 Tax=Caerostris extrusa TaxID=172846 RepID=A0AAV4V6X6_CAEEX|nr:hypothetical protein CEXT_517761 [Caerostris extrusa]
MTLKYPLKEMKKLICMGPEAFSLLCAVSFAGGCFLFGVLVGLMDVYSEFIRKFTRITRMNPSDMMLTFLPILIFESAFGMDPHVFYRALTQCMILAVPGLLFCTALTEYAHSFTIVIEGESLLNDGIAIVLYEILSHHAFTNLELSLTDSLLQLLKTLCGSIIWPYFSQNCRNYLD